MNEHEAAFAEELREGRVKRLGGVPHNEAPDAVALRLFGLNKWAEENFADLVFHIHVNDYPRRHRALPGIHTGFAIYVPDRIYANHENSRAAAEYLFSRLKKVAPVSTYGLERSGIVLDQELISLGASRSLSRPALLVEYGYVYERRFAAPARAAHLERLAEETYFALLEYFTHRP
ncbi:MAG: N-acetylmuramoyl-L-alanine amidase [Candidatus Taylorbacteria bacterium]|nr:N-acetylmuramoyl-L-alanine amidase [Candidatus Taylorbacteria bacterium]